MQTKLKGKHFISTQDWTVQELETIFELAGQLKEKHEQALLDRGIGMTLAVEAFEQRFEEIKFLRLRKGLPRLLPVDQRPVYRDPEWDKRDDPVPARELPSLRHRGWQRCESSAAAEHC